MSSKIVSSYGRTTEKKVNIPSWRLIFVFIFSPDQDGPKSFLDGPIHYDPSSANQISQHPLRPDPYESIHVIVSTSKIGDEAGEGLFSRTFIKKDQLVCLFNGIRRIKKGRVTRISANDEDWSDYRIVLGK